MASSDETLTAGQLRDATASARNAIPGAVAIVACLLMATGWPFVWLCQLVEVLR